MLHKRLFKAAANNSLVCFYLTKKPALDRYKYKTIYKGIYSRSIFYFTFLYLFYMPPSSLTGHSAHLLARATETCTTQVCQDAAAAILHDLDLNADPCSDFYQYTCKFLRVNLGFYS